MDTEKHAKARHPDAEIIERLGNTKAVADLCDISPSAVSQWKESGIPKLPRKLLQTLHPEAFSSAIGIKASA